MRGRWSQEAIAATEVSTRVAPVGLGEAVRFWAPFEEESLEFTMVWGPVFISKKYIWGLLSVEFNQTQKDCLWRVSG